MGAAWPPSRVTLVPWALFQFMTHRLTQKWRALCFHRQPLLLLLLFLYPWMAFSTTEQLHELWSLSEDFLPSQEHNNTRAFASGANRAVGTTTSTPGFPTAICQRQDFPPKLGDHIAILDKRSCDIRGGKGKPRALGCKVVLWVEAAGMAGAEHLSCFCTGGPALCLTGDWEISHTATSSSPFVFFLGHRVNTPCQKKYHTSITYCQG